MLAMFFVRLENTKRATGAIITTMMMITHQQLEVMKEKFSRKLYCKKYDRKCEE